MTSLPATPKKGTTVKYRPLPPGTRLALLIETGILLTACAVTILIAALLEGFVPLSSAWFLLVAPGSAVVGVGVGLALDTAATALLARTKRS
ncbi:hypothetical protein ABZ741_34010 [Streptomyces globisporus]|uniref:hypothetical protein n=1 Tax=Streptomyces globisporus TaxID=1908 RepID=UPI003460FD60